MPKANQLNAKQSEALPETLKTRFEKNTTRHNVMVPTNVSRERSAVVTIS